MGGCLKRKKSTRDRVNDMKRWFRETKISYIYKLAQWHSNKIYKLAQKDNSSYLEYAKREMNISWKDIPGDDMNNEMNQLMKRDILKLLSTLHFQGDSGFSIGYKMRAFDKLVKFKPISKLTFNDDEFILVGEESDRKHYQNTRLSSVFKDIYTNGAEEYYYLDGINKQDRYIVQEDQNGSLYLDEMDSHGIWSGGSFVLLNNGDIRWSPLKAVIKDKNSFNSTNPPEFVIPTYRIQYPVGWWISIIKESDLREAKKVYNIPLSTKTETTEMIKREITEFKDGQYKDEILRRLDFIINFDKFGKRKINKNLYDYVSKSDSESSKSK